MVALGAPARQSRPRLAPRTAFDVLAVGHTAWGLYAYRREVGDLLSELPGSVGDGIFDRRHSHDARAAAFWFLLVGPLLALLGRLHAAAEAAGDRDAQRASARAVTAVSVAGWVAIPRSGFPGGLALGLWLLRRARQ